MVLKTWIFFAASILLVSAPLAAHHNASAKYDSKKPITLTGKITKVEWMNPHIYFYIDVADASGKVTNWAVENGTPGGFFRRGIKKESLKLGETITVAGFLPHQDGIFHVNGRTVKFPDGRNVFVGAQDGLPDAVPAGR